MEHSGSTGGARSFVSKPVAFQGDTFRVSHFAFRFTLETKAGDGVFGHEKAPFYGATLRIKASSLA